MRIAAEVVALARERGWTITVAESCTGGMLAAALTDIPGASAVFETGYITYSNAAKSRMVGVPGALITTHGAVSEPVVRAMAEGARRASGADLAMAISGIAGPGGSERKPEGRVCYALSDETGTLCRTVDHGALGRAVVRQAATDHALAMIRDALDEEHGATG